MNRTNRVRGGAVFTTFLLALFASIVAGGVVAFIQIANVNPANPFFLERDPPEISWGQEPLGLGADAVPLTIEIKDIGIGLDEILVRISQNNTPRELLRKQQLGGIRSDTVKVTVDPKKLGLHEGKAEIQVLAFDRSLWSNGARLSKNLSVDFLKPRLDVITPQQNAVLGGSELVFYRVGGKRPDSQGVFAQGSLYPGFPARFWDDSFQGQDDLYIAFFPIPPSFDDQKDSMTILARDSIGNVASAPFNYRIRQKKWGSFSIKLDEGQAMNLKNTLAANPSNESIKARLSGDTLTDLRYLIKASARHNESILSDPLSRTEGRRLWDGAFLKPVSSYPANTAGDIRTVIFNGQEVLKGPSVGSRLTVSSRQKVLASNSGLVSFVGDLTLSGNTIVIDHGFGLSTVYAHLSEVSVKFGDEVQKGHTIGRTGTSGFSQSEEVYFEMRLHGVPVSPNEWWDESWITDHVTNKIAFVQRTVLGDASK